MEDSIIFIEDISNDIHFISNSILIYQNNFESSNKRVEQTCITIIHTRSSIDEDYFNIFTTETLPKMQEYVLYKKELILKIINLFQTIFLDFYKIVQEIKIIYEKNEQLMSIRKDLDILIQDITFYKSI